MFYFTPEALWILPIYAVLIFLFCKLQNFFIASSFTVMYLILTPPKPFFVDVIGIVCLYYASCYLYDIYLQLSERLKHDES